MLINNIYSVMQPLGTGFCDSYDHIHLQWLTTNTMCKWLKNDMCAKQEVI